MHNNNLELFKLYGLPLIKPGDRVLEIGPDWSVPGGRVKPLIQEAGAAYHFCGLDNNGRSSDGFVAMDGPYAIVSPVCRFDVIVSLSVVEHVPKIWQWFREQKRVLEQGGLIIAVNPTSWPYHESPVDCWRLYPEGYKALFGMVGLDHVLSWEGNVVDLECHLRAEHGPHRVRDCIAIGRKPIV